MLYYLPVFMSLYVSRFGKGFQSDQRQFAMLVSIGFRLVHRAQDATVTSQVFETLLGKEEKRQKSTQFSSLDHSIETQECLPRIVNSNGNLRRDCHVPDKTEHLKPAA